MTVQAMKGGAVEFLTKPFDDEVLLSAIRHSIQRSASVLEDQAEQKMKADSVADLVKTAVRLGLTPAKNL